MDSKIVTVKDLMERFDSYRRTPKGNVIIHPNLPANLIELKEDFVEELKQEIKTELLLVEIGISEISPTTKFVIMLLEDSF